ncbi:MAG TPA: FHA domain-containing protein [Microlunatus sp.]|nr:FHA domain-containing protein [Microlunatus sp.]
MTQRRTSGATMRVRADLQLDLSQGGDQGGTELGITIRSESDVVHVRLDRVPDLAARPSSELIRNVAAGLVGQGLRVIVEGPDGRLVSFGSGVRTPWWQRPFVRAAHVRVHDLRAALRTLPRGGRKGGAAGIAPPAMLFTPPPTVLPLAPTVLRRQRISTTHDPAGGGSPRLFFPAADSAGSRLKVFFLRPEISVGDREDADLRLRGVAAHQAVIRRNAQDEYVIEPDPDGLPVRVHGARLLGPTQLRTGARIEIGTWQMVYFRAEHADHGRPYGGRQGGEIDQQQWQPPARYRPDIRDGTSGGSGG